MSKTRKKYELQSGDYSKEISLSDSLKVGICSIIGEKQKQQDALAYSLIKNFHMLSEKKKTLQNTCENLQKIYGQHEKCGSTLNATIARMTKTKLEIVNMNLGDSLSFAILIDSEKVTTKLISKLNQKPIGYLSMNKSIGNISLECKGLSHEPEIKEYDIELKENSRVFILNASDGLRDSKCSTSYKHIGNIIQTNANEPLDKIASALVMQAYDNNSNDNISVNLIELKPDEPPVSLAVFDGHGIDGETVSQSLAENFYVTLLKKINGEELVHQKSIFSSSVEQPVKLFESSLSSLNKKTS